MSSPPPDIYLVPDRQVKVSPYSLLSSAYSVHKPPLLFRRLSLCLSYIPLFLLLIAYIDTSFLSLSRSLSLALVNPNLSGPLSLSLSLALSLSRTLFRTGPYVALVLALADSRMLYLTLSLCT